MFPPASSNRSKNSRSRGARTLASRTGRKLALVHVEPGQLDPARRQLADALPDGLGRRLPVVLHAALLQAVAVEHRVRSAMVAVPRHPDAARVDQLDAAWAGARELEMRVAEHDAWGLDAHEQLRVELARLREKALHVALRRGVAIERAARGRPLGEREQLLDKR